VIAFLHRHGGEPADVGAAFLLGHELAALRQPAHVGLSQSVEIFFFQRRAAEFREKLGAPPKANNTGHNMSNPRLEKITSNVRLAVGLVMSFPMAHDDLLECFADARNVFLGQIRKQGQ